MVVAVEVVEVEVEDEDKGRGVVVVEEVGTRTVVTVDDVLEDVVVVIVGA